MSKVIEVTDQTFEEEVLQSEVPCEVDFWAPWCGPCKRVAPIYDALSEEYDNFKFCKVNVDENRTVAMQYGIQSIPMQMFFANGEKVDELLGAVPEQQIRDKVEDVLKRFPADEKGRLESIISAWVEHNRQDHQRFQKWAEQAEEMKKSPIYTSLLKAAEDMNTLTEQLAQLANEL